MTDEAHTVRFALDGREYEIDLSEKNADAIPKDVIEQYRAVGN